jgi:hypothetical protein
MARLLALFQGRYELAAALASPEGVQASGTFLRIILEFWLGGVSVLGADKQ